LLPHIEANLVKGDSAMPATIAVGLFVFLMLAAAVSDLRWFKLPNWLVVAVAVLFFPAALATGMNFGLSLWHVLASLLVLLGGFALFSAGFLGGGDAKLLAAVALWLGWADLPMFLLYTALAGGALAVAMLVWEVVRTHFEITGNPESSLMRRLTSLRPDLPYGVAIAAGACITLPHTWWAPALTPFING
jgi:prepilin peptidase CpaA